MDWEIRRLEETDEADYLTLLTRSKLQRDSSLTVIWGIFDNGQLAGAGGVSGNTIRGVCIHPKFSGTNALGLLVGRLRDTVLQTGHDNVFVFTSPQSAESFERTGFYPVQTRCGAAVLLESRPDGLSSYLKKLAGFKHLGNSAGVIVMNANPFSLGHLHLVTYAAAHCEHLHIFVLSEDRSTFPAAVRHRLVAESVAGRFENVTLHKSGPYIISNSTFPTYFLKNGDASVNVHAEMDLRLFGQHIAPALGITHRFVGEEPYCPTTRAYNDAMKAILPEYGIAVVEIPRLHSGNTAISASEVRRLMAEGKSDELKTLVPESTYRYLVSPEGRELAQKIALNNSRH